MLGVKKLLLSEVFPNGTALLLRSNECAFGGTPRTLTEFFTPSDNLRFQRPR